MSLVVHLVSEQESKHLPNKREERKEEEEEEKVKKRCENQKVRDMMTSSSFKFFFIFFFFFQKRIVEKLFSVGGLYTHREHSFIKTCTIQVYICQLIRIGGTEARLIY